MHGCTCGAVTWIIIIDVIAVIFPFKVSARVTVTGVKYTIRILAGFAHVNLARLVTLDALGILDGARVARVVVSTRAACYKKGHQTSQVDGGQAGEERQMHGSEVGHQGHHN